MLWIRIDERLQSRLSWWSSNRNEQGHRMQDPENVLVRESTKIWDWKNPPKVTRVAKPNSYLSRWTSAIETPMLGCFHQVSRYEGAIVCEYLANQTVPCCCVGCVSGVVERRNLLIIEQFKLWKTALPCLQYICLRDRSSLGIDLGGGEAHWL